MLNAATSRALKDGESERTARLCALYVEEIMGDGVRSPAHLNLTASLSPSP